MATPTPGSGASTDGAALKTATPQFHVIRALLGPNVVLLKWPLRSKGLPKKWGHLTIRDMTPDYVAKLAGGNVGVALGAISGGLIAVDVDDDALVPSFLAVNPSWEHTLQTHGARGRVFWLQMVGEYPRTTRKLKTVAGIEAGEWRAGKNAQSIIYGIHPTGIRYQVVKLAKPLLVDFGSIVWPSTIANPPVLSEELLTTGTEEPEEPEEPDDTEDTEEVECVLFSVQSVDDALRLSQPTAPHQNFRLALVLARGVKAIELQRGSRFTPAEHRNLHNQWLKRAAPFLRPGQNREDYFMEYLNAYRLAKYPLGSVAVGKALKAAKENPLPPDALPWTENPDVRLLGAICRELQNAAGDSPFYLSARVVQRVFKHETHSIAAKWLRSLCVMRFLDETEKGKGMRASRYRCNVGRQ